MLGSEDIDLSEERDAYTLKEIAQRTGLSEGTIRREVAAGLLRSKKIRGRRIVLAEWYREWLASEETPGPVAPGRAARKPGKPAEGAPRDKYPWEK